MNKDRLIQATTILAEDRSFDDGDLVDKLVESGFTALEAELVVCFVPMAFAHFMIRGPATMVREHISAMTETGSFVDVPLKNIPIYIDALSLARELWTSQTIDRKAIGAIAGRSAEMNLAVQISETGGSQSDYEVSAALVRLSAIDLGYVKPGFWSRLRARFTK